MSTAHANLLPAEVCARIKSFGYAASQRIRIYGEEFDVLSDPFPSADGIAIHVRSKRTSQTRVLQLPATIVQTASSQLMRAA